MMNDIVLIVLYCCSNQVARLEKMFYMAKRDLERLNNEVASLEEQLQALAKQYEAAMTDRMALQSEAELMERRAIAAGRCHIRLSGHLYNFGITLL